MGVNIDNMTTEVIPEPEAVDSRKDGGENTEWGSKELELKRKIAIELRTRARGFDD
jgi:hypothetical protein